MAGDGVAQGVIEISVEVGQDEAQVTIHDDGIGPAQDELEDIRQLIPGRRNKRKRVSTGFGLPTAAKYMEAHGGRLTIDGSENDGTKDSLRLPQELMAVTPWAKWRSNLNYGQSIR